MSLRKRLLHLAHSKPELRAKLVPVLREGARRKKAPPPPPKAKARANNIGTRTEDLLRKLDPKADPEDLDIEAENLLDALVWVFVKRSQAMIKRFEGESRSRRPFQTKGTDMEWSEYDSDGADEHHYWEATYPSLILLSMGAKLKEANVISDALRSFRSDVNPKAVAKAAQAVVADKDFLPTALARLADEGGDKGSRDDHFLLGTKLEEDIGDYVWNEADEDSAITENGVEDEIMGTSPNDIHQTIRATRKIVPNPGKFGFRMDYRITVNIRVDGWF